MDKILIDENDVYATIRDLLVESALIANRAILKAMEKAK